MKNEQTLTEQQKRYHVNLLAEDAKGVLGRMIGMIYRPGYTLMNVNVSETDIKNIVLITIEVVVSPNQIKTLVRKMEKIVEVNEVNYFEVEDEEIRTVAHYRLSIESLQKGTNQHIQKFGAQIISMDSTSLTIEKIARKKEILELYNCLDGVHLISFCSSSLMAQHSL
ncbi:MAG: hypothetical protein EOO90_12645 [Pedobacter sp.]|nr:MAG: hypothetical protein EOO90_12645 [Pedobacter sp.]